MEDLNKKILEQVEYYFSDSSLVKDKFLKEAVNKDPEGYVPISTLLTFHRLKALSQDPAVVAEALKASSFLKVSEDNLKVKRITPLPENVSFVERTVYARGFPDDSTLESVRDFFAPYGKVLSIKLRKTEDKEKKFKNSVFVEFSTPEEAQKFVDAKPALPLDMPPKEHANIMMKKDFVQHKAELHGESTQANAEKKKAAELAAVAAIKELSSGVKADAAAPEVAAMPAAEFVKNLVVKIENIPPLVSREDMRAAFVQFGDLKYIEFEREQGFCYLRFGEPEHAQAVLAAGEISVTAHPRTEKPKVEDEAEDEEEAGDEEAKPENVPEAQPTPAVGETRTVKSSLVTGDEEIEYWKRLKAARTDRRDRGGRGRGRGGRGRGRGRGRGGKRERGGRGGTKRGRRDE